MALSTTQYGYIIDPMVPFTDGKGKTIKDGFVRVFVAGSSTPVVTYRNFDGAANQDLIELDNSGRTKTSVIGSKGLAYKVCVYDAFHSQESPILTVDKVSAIGANITAGSGSTVVTGLDGLTTKPDGFVDASVVGTDGYVALDHTLVTDDLDTDAKVTAVEEDRYVPLLNEDVNDPDSKMTLGRMWQWVLGKIKSLPTTITTFRTGDVIPVDGPDGTAKMDKDSLLQETAQNALGSIHDLANTATESDLVDGNYLPLDGTNGTKKLPSNTIAKISSSRLIKNYFENQLVNTCIWSSDGHASYNQNVWQSSFPQKVRKGDRVTAYCVAYPSQNAISFYKIADTSNYVSGVAGIDGESYNLYEFTASDDGYVIISTCNNVVQDAFEKSYFSVDKKNGYYTDSIYVYSQRKHTIDLQSSVEIESVENSSLYLLDKTLSSNGIVDKSNFCVVNKAFYIGVGNCFRVEVESGISFTANYYKSEPVDIATTKPNGYETKYIDNGCVLRAKCDWVVISFNPATPGDIVSNYVGKLKIVNNPNIYKVSTLSFATRTELIVRYSDSADPDDTEGTLDIPAIITAASDCSFISSCYGKRYAHIIDSGLTQFNICIEKIRFLNESDEVFSPTYYGAMYNRVCDVSAIANALLQFYGKVEIKGIGDARINTSLVIKWSNTSIFVDPTITLTLRDNYNLPMVVTDSSFYDCTQTTHLNTNVLKNISIVGGIWQQNGSAQTKYVYPNHIPGEGNEMRSFPWQSCFRLADLKGVRFTDVTIKNPISYGVYIGNVEEFLFENIYLDYYDRNVINMDGIHFCGDVKNGIISNIYGQTHDDLVALNVSGDYDLQLGASKAMMMREGSAENVQIKNINGDNALVAVRLLCGTGFTINNVVIDGITGTFVGSRLFVFGGWAETAEIGKVTIANVSAKLDNADRKSLIAIGDMYKTTLKSLILENVHMDSDDMHIFRAQVATSGIDKIVMSNCVLNPTNTLSDRTIIRGNFHFDDMIITSCDIGEANNSGNYHEFGVLTGKLLITNTFLYMESVPSVSANVKISNSFVNE